MSADSTAPLEPLSGASQAASDKTAEWARGTAGWRWPLVTVGAVLLIFAALQLWRPYFFLTDDNMSGVLPSFVDNGLQFKQGQLPPIIWQDPGAISILFPSHIAAALLATTSFKLAVVDAVSLLNLLAGALGMQACVIGFCRRFEREVPDALAAFLGISYMTSIYTLAIGSSWHTFLANQAAVPIIALGFVTPARTKALLLISAGMFYNMVGGHLSPFFFSAFFLGVLCIVVALLTKDWAPIWRFAVGSIIAVAVVSPFLIGGAFSTFSATTRNVAFALESAARYNLPAPALMLGATLGIDSIGGWDFQPTLGFLAEVPLPLAFSAAALCLLGVLTSARKFRKLEWSIVAIMLLVALFVHRPLWLQAIISHVPFYRSLRWPMRETFVFLFLAHLLVAFGWAGLPRILRRALPPLSAAAFTIALLLTASPTLNRFPVDRLLLTEGRAERVWKEVRTLLPHASNCQVVPLLDHAAKGWGGPVFIAQAPHTLLGGYNYPQLFGMKSATGYTMLGSTHTFRGQTPLVGPGYFTPDFSQKDLEDPDLLFTRLQSLDPVTIEYRIGTQIVHATFPDGMASDPVVARVR